MTATDARPRRTPPPEDQVWRVLGAALKRFMARYDLTQAWVAETLKVSQPQVSYLLGATMRERPRELSPGELLLMEQRVRKEINPDLVLGEILRDAGLVEDVGHPADVVASYPFLTVEAREDIMALIERNEARFRTLHGPDVDSEPSPPRLVRGVPAQGPGSSPGGRRASQPKRRRG